MKDIELLTQWNEAFLTVGIDIISTDRASMILAMVYVLGGSHSSYTYSVKLRADLAYISKRYGICGGGVPDKQIAKLTRRYVRELESAYFNATEKSEAGLRVNWYPKWATEIAKYYGLPQNNSI